MTVSPVWGNPDRQTLDRLPATPVVSVDTATGARLRDMLMRGEATVCIHTEVDTGWLQTPILTARLLPFRAAPEVRELLGHLKGWQEVCPGFHLALSLPPVPSLTARDELAWLPDDSDEARFRRVELVRSRNRITRTLLEAAERLETWQ